MKWQNWPDPDVRQLYEVEMCDSGILECVKDDETLYFPFVADDIEAKDVFHEAEFVRVAAHGSPPVPARKVEGGWEHWTDNVQAVDAFLYCHGICSGIGFCE